MGATERWINRDAVEWVLYESDVNGDRKPVLLAVATFTDADGRGAYPAASLLALMTGKHRVTVARSLVSLVKHGHLAIGDWQLAAHVRSDRRPVVYDLPDGYRLWRKERRSKSLHREPEPVDNSSRGSKSLHRDESTVYQDRVHGVANRAERCSKSLHKEFLKNSGIGARSGAQPSAAPHTAQTSHEPTSKEPRCRECANRLDDPYHRRVCPLGKAQT